MKRNLITAGAIALLLGAALSVSAQPVPAGDDRWVTPGDGSTFFSFPDGDVESLCGAAPSADWNHEVKLVGVPEPGWDWDTVVRRLEDVDLADLPREIKIQVTRLVFKSISSQDTPCGELLWTVKLDGNQPITKMRIEPGPNVESGVFFADIVVRVVFHATDTRGNAIGELYYTMELPDHVGVPWSYEGGVFRPGIDERDNCIHVLREKLAVATGRHKYYIENLIAKGRCDEVASVTTLSLR
jgi:hypothetical protein